MVEAVAQSDATMRVQAIAGTLLASSAEQLGWSTPDGSCRSLRSKQTTRFCGNGRRASGVVGISSANARVTPQFDFLLASRPLVLEMDEELLLLATANWCCGVLLLVHGKSCRATVRSPQNTR